jgi:hypothetical protein
MAANQITVFLDPAAMPSRLVQDQQTFDNLVAAVFAAFPTFGAQFNAGIANFNAAAAGSAYAIPYTVDLSGTTDVDPGSGKLRFDNATQNLATTLRLDVLGTGSPAVDYTAMIDTFDASTSTVKGHIRIVKQGDASKFLLFNVTARTAPSGYRDISVTPVASSSANPFVAGDAVLLFFQRTGDMGAVGPAVTYQAIYVRDEKAQGTDGGTLPTSGLARTLNTVKYNNVTGASLASNQVTLPAGTYEYVGTVPYNNSGTGYTYSKAQLFNVTDAVSVDFGTSEYSTDESNAAMFTTHSVVRGVFTISAPKTFQLRHFCTPGTFGYIAGKATNFVGAVEVYAELLFKKVA